MLKLFFNFKVNQKSWYQLGRSEGGAKRCTDLDSWISRISWFFVFLPNRCVGWSFDHFVVFHDFYVLFQILMLGEAFKKNGLKLSVFSVSQKHYKYKNAVDKRTKNMKISKNLHTNIMIYLRFFGRASMLNS